MKNILMAANIGTLRRCEKIIEMYKMLGPIMW